MVEVEYFFDSYAVIEILKKNGSYNPYLGFDVHLTVFNLAEIYYSVLDQYGEEKAETVYDEYKKCILEISEDILKDAMKFRRAHKKKRLSYADCIGYVCALENKMKFLTGDTGFQGMKNVEFVK